MTSMIVAQAAPEETVNVAPSVPADAPLSGFQLAVQQANELLAAGGPVVAIILGLSILASAICLLKVYQFWRLGAWGKTRASEALEAWRAGNAQQALSSLHGLRSPSGEALFRAMRMRLENADEPAIREEAERVALDGLFHMRRMTGALGVIAQAAPLLGLFGTVLGMIEAFRTLQEAGSAVDPALLAGGIWVALLTTAAGLALAIPLGFVLAWFEATITAEAHRAEQLLTRFFASGTSHSPLLASEPDVRRIANAH